MSFCVTAEYGFSCNFVVVQVEIGNGAAEFGGFACVKCLFGKMGCFDDVADAVAVWLTGSLKKGGDSTVLMEHVDAVVAALDLRAFEQAENGMACGGIESA